VFHAARAQRCRPAAVLAVVLVVLGMLCGPAARAAETVPARAGTEAPGAAGSARAAGTPRTAGASETVGTAEAARTAEAGATAPASAPVPGCKHRTPFDGIAGPSVPARHLPSYELMPALFEARGAPGGWGLEQALVPDPERRAAPPAGPSTPVDLSVLLRV
jgi:hypothetical protein